MQRNAPPCDAPSRKPLSQSLAFAARQVDVKMDNGVVINPLLRQSYGKAKT